MIIPTTKSWLEEGELFPRFEELTRANITLLISTCHLVKYFIEGLTGLADLFLKEE